MIIFSGIILSGSDIAHVLSLFLTYYGGSGNRPRWISIGVALSATSCIVLAIPHLIYGSGKDALSLTQEYLDHNLFNATTTQDIPTCSGNQFNPICDVESLEDASMLPRLLVFFSQVFLGFGSTLYYGLGQAYLDDNTKKKNTPMLLGAFFNMFFLRFNLKNLLFRGLLSKVAIISKILPKIHIYYN